MRAPSSTSDEPPPLESGFLGPASATARVSGGIARRESPLAGKAGEPAAGGLASQLQSLTLKASLANSSGRPPAAPLAPPVAAALAPVGAPVYLSASFRDPASLPQFPVAISEENDETGIESDEDERYPATGGALRPGGESSVSLVEAAAAAAAVMAAAGGSRAAGAPPGAFISIGSRRPQLGAAAAAPAASSMAAAASEEEPGLALPAEAAVDAEAAAAATSGGRGDDGGIFEGDFE